LVLDGKDAWDNATEEAEVLVLERLVLERLNVRTLECLEPPVLESDEEAWCFRRRAPDPSSGEEVSGDGESNFLAWVVGWRGDSDIGVPMRSSEFTLGMVKA
jgi:hypothetical protein